MSAYRSARLPVVSGQPCSQPLEEASLILNEAEAVLDPVADIDRFLLGCLVDASTGMILAARKDQDDISLPTAAAGAADIANVLSLLAGELPTDGLEDVMVTFRSQLYVIRTPGPAAADSYPATADSIPPLGRILALRTVTEPIIDAVLELFTAQARYAKFRPSRLPAAGLAPGIDTEALLAEVARRQRLMKQQSAVLTPDTAIARNPHLRSESIRVSAWQWALLIRVAPGCTPRDLAWDLGRSVFGTMTDVYRLLMLRLLSAAGADPEHHLTAVSFVRAAAAKKGNIMPVIKAGTAAEDDL
jgi:hypothetical protein